MPLESSIRKRAPVLGDAIPLSGVDPTKVTAAIAANESATAAAQMTANSAASTAGAPVSVAAHANSTGTTVSNGVNWVDLPGTTLNMTTTGVATLFVTASAGLNRNGSSGYAELAIVVDGTAYPIGQTQQVNADDRISGSLVISGLSAGAHTLKLSARHSAAAYTGGMFGRGAFIPSIITAIAFQK